MRRPLLAFAALAALAAPLALAAPAGAVIVPQKGMAGVRLDMTRAEVRAVLGAPDALARRNDDFGPVTIYRYDGPAIHLMFRQGRDDRLRLVSASTRAGRERTSKGVGVGSTEGRVRRDVPRVKCETFPYTGTRSCHVGSYEPGTVVTDFVIARNGRVGSVTVGVVID